MFHHPWGLAVDFNGNIFVGEYYYYHRIRKVTPDGLVSTFAGSVGGYADGVGTNAMFNSPLGIAVDSSSNLFVSDYSNHRIRKVSSSGIVSTFAGSGTAGFSDGTGTNAMFNSPTGITVDVSDNLFLCDRVNHRIRKITSTGVVSTFAGGNTWGTTDGIGTNAQFNFPNGVTIDLSGNIFVADYVNHRIRKITTSGVVTTIAGSGGTGFADGTGTNAIFSSPTGIAVDAYGVIFVSDSENHRIRMITSAGVVTTIAGTGAADFADGMGANAKFHTPFSATFDRFGNLYIAEYYGQRIRKITFTPSLPGPLPVCDSTWHHIALTYTGSSSTNTLDAYVDGSSVASSTSSTFAISSSLSTSTLLRSRYQIRLRSRYQIRLRSRYQIRLRSRYQIRLRSRYQIRLRSRYQIRLRSRYQIRLRSL
jgi:sugar lactone lactonase YvrE